MATMIPDFTAPAPASSASTALFGSDTMTQLSIVLDELRANEKYNDPPEKLDKAYEACLEDRVEGTTTPGSYLVASRQAAEGQYETHDGTCSCPYGTHHPQERYGCYHSVAAVLYARWQQNLTPLTVPLAPISSGAPGSLQSSPPVRSMVPRDAEVTTVHQLEARLGDWGLDRKVVLRFIKQALVETSDYGGIHIKKDCKDRSRCKDPYHFTKDCLFKPGSEKFLAFFQYKAVFHTDGDTWEMLGRPPGVLCFVCHLVDPTGAIAGEGRGIADVQKHTGDYNKAVKMAEKSSMLDAILRTGCLSDVFTQDLDDGDEEAETPLPSAPRADTPVPPSDALRGEIAQLLAQLGSKARTLSEYQQAVYDKTGLALERPNFPAIVAQLRTLLKALSREGLPE